MILLLHCAINYYCVSLQLLISLQCWKLCLVGTTKEHLGLAMALKVPTLVIVNKTDICLPTMVGHTLKVLDRLLKSPGCKKVPVVVETEDDVIVAATNFISNQ